MSHQNSPRRLTHARVPLAAHAFLLSCLTLAFSTEVLAQRGGPAEWNLMLENDLWGDGSDGHYTHGTRISRLSTNPAQWVKRIAGHLPCQACRELEAVQWQLGQDLYTPEATWRAYQVEDDRPYAGWLYGGVRLLGGTQTSKAYRLDTVGIDIGFVGPSAMAERTQGIIHDARSMPIAQGWAHQLEDEFGLVVSYRREWHHEKGEGRVSGDVAPYITGALGNVSTHLSAGLSLKTGVNFRAHRLAERRAGSGWHIFLDLETRAVARNIFLDGNTRSESHRVEKELLIGEVTVGLKLTVGRFGVTFATMIRSREFVGQREPDRYGAVSFSYRP